MKRKKITKQYVRICEICGNEIYKLRTVKCPFCGKINEKITNKQDMIKL